MPPTLADRLRRDLAEVERLAVEELNRRNRWRRPFARKLKARPPPKPAKIRSGRGSDLAVAALGIALGLLCAVFPWYIFLNPQQFGIRAIEFTGDGDYRMGGRVPLSPAPDRFGSLGDMLAAGEDLDPLSTGTAVKTEEERAQPEAPAAADQPFPAAPVVFELVEIVNGRAMLRDDTGLFFAQRGSLLPDGSRVGSIEQRDGRWVVVTTDNDVLSAAR